jgi:ribokinase
LRANLSAEGIDVEFVQVDATSASGIAMLTLDEAGSDIIVVAIGGNMSLTRRDVAQAFQKIAAMDAVVLQLVSLLDWVLQAARLGKERGTKEILNPAPARLLPAEVYKT